MKGEVIALLIFQVIRDQQLLIMVGCFLAIDVAFLFTWQIVDPLHRQIIYKPIIEVRLIYKGTVLLESFLRCRVFINE